MNKRKQFLIDKNTQFSIAKRLVAFWFLGGTLVAGFPVFAMLAYGVLIVGMPISEVSAQIVDAMWFPVTMFVLIVPFGIWRSIRFSNRIAGPIFRIKREIRRLVSGDESFEVHLRRQDFFKDLGEAYNGLREKVLNLETEIRELRGSAGSASAEAGERSYSSVGQ